MEVTKYVITNNLSVLYNTREVAKLETAFARGASVHSSTFHSKITIKTSWCTG